MCTATDQVTSGLATWSPQVGTCCYRHHPMHSTPKALEEFKGENDHNKGSWKKEWGGTTKRIGTHWIATKGPRILTYRCHRPNGSCSGYIPSNPGLAKQKGQDESNDELCWVTLLERPLTKVITAATFVSCEQGVDARRGHRVP